MIDQRSFARVKILFDRLCDLPGEARRAALDGSDEDAEVVAEVRRMLEKTAYPTARFERPVLDALAQVAIVPLQSGDTLGAWTLVEEIGEGGMGRIFRARRSDGHFEQVAAIKLLSGLPSHAALLYLTRERQILASLSHPHIARLLDGGSTPQGQPYLVMEYVDGKTIDRYCVEHDLSLTARLRLFLDVCAAVSFAHHQLVIHCDLKPSNILVTASGRPILLDFGVSRLLADAGGMATVPGASGTSVQTVPGAAYTPRYASPEQKSAGHLGAATDVYSLGMTLVDVLGATLDPDGRPNLRGIPAELAAVIAKTILPDAADRYASVDALADDIVRYLEHRPLLASKPSTRYIARKWLRRHWAGAGMSLLLLVVVSAFSWRMRVERDNALNAEHATRAVKDYMVSVFQGADPEISGQRDLPVSKLLDAGRDRLRAELADQPRTRADIAGILASVYQTIGQRDQASAMLTEAIALERGNDRPLALADLLYRQAFTTYDIEDFVAAEPGAREALELRERFAPDSLPQAASQQLLGLILSHQGKFQEAQALLTSALNRTMRLAGPQSVEAGRAHVDLSRHLFNADAPAEQVSDHADIAGRIFTQALGHDHYLHADALELSIAGLLQDRAYAKAIPMARELSERRAAIYGAISNQNGYGLHTYGATLRMAGRRLESIPVFEQCIDIQTRLDGNDTLSMVVPLIEMARARELMGDLERALNGFEAGWAMRARLSPDDLAGQNDVRHYVGQTLRLLGRFAEAEPHLAAVLAGRTADTETVPVRLFESQLELATLHRQRGQLDAAEGLLAAAAKLELGDDAWKIAYAEAEQAQIALLKGAEPQAARLFASARAHVEAGLGPAHPDTWLIRVDEAEWLARSGRAGEARALADQILRAAAPSIAPGGSWERRLTRLGGKAPPTVADDAGLNAESA
jgi:eukaryotic-like serine/threonine-protein kinase